MKKVITGLLALALSLGVSAAHAQEDLAEDANNPQYSALLQQLKLGTCEADTYGASLDSDDGLPYDLNFGENLAVNRDIMNEVVAALSQGGSTAKIVKTVKDSPISFIHIVDVDGDKMADRYVYLSGYEFNEWCWLK